MNYNVARLDGVHYLTVTVIAPNLNCCKSSLRKP